jgi:hypothetical protein
VTLKTRKPFRFRRGYVPPPEPEAPAKPRRNPLSRARAKRWLAREYPHLKIATSDGDKIFHVVRRDGGDQITDLRFGEFRFTNNSPRREREAFVEPFQTEAMP